MAAIKMGENRIWPGRYSMNELTSLKHRFHMTWQGGRGLTTMGRLVLKQPPWDWTHDVMTQAFSISSQ